MLMNTIKNSHKSPFWQAERHLSRLLVLMLLCFFVSFAQAQSGWIDMTSEYIVNPNFDNASNEGWEGSNIGHAQGWVWAGEFWNTTFDTYQHVRDLPNGHYRVSVSALYRPGDSNQNLLNQHFAGNESINAYVYANEEEVQVKACYGEYATVNANGAHYLYNSEIGSSVYYPNSMESGEYYFTLGMYQNVLEVDVTDGQLVVGIYCDDYQQYNWCLFDNWRLELWGTIRHVERIILPQSAVTLGLGESRAIEAEVYPEDATYRKLTWSSTNESVVTVSDDGIAKGMGKGTATIIAAAIDGSNVSASCSVTVTSDGATKESLVINEIMVANIDTYLDPSFNYGGYMELYNPTDKSAGLARYYVSDDAANLTKYRLPVDIGSIPAHGYMNLWFDHYDWHYGPHQVDIELNPEGGTLYIANDEGVLVASQSYPASVSRASWCRVTDGADTWRYTSTPTPEASNDGSTYADEQLPAPEVQQDSQLFKGTLSVHVAIPDGAQLRYTTDGSVPTLTNGTTSRTGVVTVRKTAVYRFRLFQDGMLPSPVTTRSFIVRDKEYTLPILSVATAHDNLYSTAYGVFTKGPNGRAGNGQNDKCNWNMDWDRPVNFELITEEGVMAINQEVNLSMCGGWSRAWGHHSFKLKADRQYDGHRNYYDYPIFEEKPFNKNKTVQIRNGGNDSDCRIKDAALQAIIARSGLDADCQGYVPVMHFINGTYIGLINMREPNNKHFAFANYGLSAEEQDQFEISPDSGYIQMAGTKEAFDRWYRLAEDAADDAVYDEIKKLVDVDNFVNYIALEFYLGNWDWPKNNLKAFRPRTEDGRFRFVTFDLDGAFSVGDPFTTFESKRIFTFDALRGEYSGQITAEIEVVTIFLNMLQNARFRKQFTDAFCLITGSVFEPSRCRQIITELATRIEEPLSYEWASPWGTANDLINRLNSSYQTRNINYMKNYSRLKLSGTSSVTATLSTNIDAARLTVNDLPVPTNRFSGKLFAPVTVRAQAPSGYTFKGWVSSLSTTTTEILAAGSAWHYYDQGSLDGTGWNRISYDDSSWPAGNAPLGYYVNDTNNSRGYNTQLGFGGDTNNKYPTSYFRTSVTLTDTPSKDDVFTLDYTCDDGFIIYVNGTEAGRYLMPSGTPTFNTYASTYASGNPDSGSLTLSSTLFKKGKNTIAVELHNNAANSTDIYWDASLVAEVTSTGGGSFISTDEEYTLPSTGTVSLIAIYERNDGSQPTADGGSLRINEVSPANDIYVNDLWKKNDWIELYNSTDDDIDLTGWYLSDDTLNRQMFQIPAVEGVNNVVPAHGYKIVWCDKLEPVNQPHTDFKLASEGGYVLLTSPREDYCDSFHYPFCGSKQTVGLYPDGGTATYVMQRPTIGHTNIITTADVAHTQLRPTAVDGLPAPEPATDDALYDLFGRRVTDPQPGTIYIQQGRKVLYQLR